MGSSNYGGGSDAGELYTGAATPISRFKLLPMKSGGLPRVSVGFRDVIAVDVKFGGETGRRLWDEVVRRKREFDSILHREVEAELGPRWDSMVTVYKGSTHVNIVTTPSNDGDGEHGDYGNAPSEDSIFERIVRIVRRSVAAFVEFAMDVPSRNSLPL